MDPKSGRWLAIPMPSGEVPRQRGFGKDTAGAGDSAGTQLGHHLMRHLLAYQKKNTGLVVCWGRIYWKIWKTPNVMVKTRKKTWCKPAVSCRDTTFHSKNHGKNQLFPGFPINQAIERKDVFLGAGGCWKSSKIPESIHYDVVQVGWNSIVPF